MATLQDLRNVYRKLDARDQEFACSMGKAHNQYGSWTPKQQAAVDRLIARANRPAAAKVGNFQALTDLFNLAGQKLKRPFIVARCDDTEIKVSPAGATSKNPGALYVTVRKGEYLGKITPDGEWRPNSDVVAHLPSLLTLLTDLAADPASTAAAQGHAFGQCCFCAKELTDKRSVDVGYGPICAENFGLPWGTK